jgi:hypothetical protein
MFSGLDSSSILAETTTWVSPFEGVTMVVVGVGLAFACVRFVKSLFF